MDKGYRHKYFPKVDIVPVCQTLEYTVKVQYADYVVDGVLIDRDAGEGGVHYLLHYLLHGVIYVYGGHVHTGGDYLVGQHIVKVQRALQ